MPSHSIWPNKGNLQISLTVVSHDEQHSQLERSEPGERTSSSWPRSEFFRRWIYTRQVRADPRLLAIIKMFSRRIRSVHAQPKQTSEHMRQPVRERTMAVEETASRSLQHSRLSQQVVSNPVVQEVMRVFRAEPTDITPIPPAASSFPSVNSKLMRYDFAEEPNQGQDTEMRRSRIHWIHPEETSSDQEERINQLEERVHTLETQLRRRELEKEALRRQVKKLGGDKPWA